MLLEAGGNLLSPRLSDSPDIQLNMLSFNFILGFNIVLVCFKLIIIHYHIQSVRIKIAFSGSLLKLAAVNAIKLNSQIGSTESFRFSSDQCVS